MGLNRVFDDRSLRTKIGTAVLVATIAGAIVGLVGIKTVRSMNSDAAAAQRQTITVEQAVGTFSKSVENYVAQIWALDLYPGIATALKEKIAIDSANISS